MARGLIAVTVDGLGPLKAALGDMAGELQLEVNKAVAEVAAGAEAQAKMLMQQQSPSGKTYKRRGVIHRASSPGQHPQPDTGDLLRSIYHEQDRPGVWIVGSRLVYALYLEYGTRRMAARPLWRRPLKGWITTELREAIEDAVRKVAR